MSKYNDNYKMYCPMCGSLLEEIPEQEPDWDDDDPRWDSYFPGSNKNFELQCKNCNCFGEGFPLILHHPLGGMDSAPGDFWSLTWLK